MSKNRAQDGLDKPVLGMLLGGLLLVVIVWGIAETIYLDQGGWPATAGAAIVKQLSGTNLHP